MEDLIHTVRQRYGRSVGFWNLSTLTHRRKPAGAAQVPSPEEIKDKGKFFSFLRPHLSDISQKIQAEIKSLLDRREKTVLQTANHPIPRMIQRQTQQWKTESVLTEKARLETAKRMEKRVELFVTDAGMKIKTVQRELNRLKIQDKARQEQMRTDMRLLHQSAKRAALESAERERAALRHELDHRTAQTERRIVRKLRDEEAYERWRRG